MGLAHSLKYKRNPTHTPQNSQMSLLLCFSKALISKLSTYILNSWGNLMHRHLCFFMFLYVQGCGHTRGLACGGQKTVLMSHTVLLCLSVCFPVSHWHGTCPVGCLPETPGPALLRLPGGRLTCRHHQAYFECGLWRAN